MGAGELILPNGPRRFERGVPPPGGAGDVLLARQPIVGMLQDDAERLLNEMLAPIPPVCSPDQIVPGRGWTAVGVRHYLSPVEGDGYWDFYRPWPGLMLSVTDATYRSDTWVNVEGTGYFKLRMLVSGTLRGRSREIIASAPETLLYVSPGTSREGYYIDSSGPARMIVLHCRPHLLTHVLGLGPQDIPAPLSSLLGTERSATRLRVTPSPEIIRTARRIMESRHTLSHALRDRYLQTLSMELLLQVLGTLEGRTLVPGGPTRGGRDAARVYHARDYLARHYVNPPNIAELAGRIGLNRTKLKESFRRIFGCTIYEYILRLRMERAAEMLVTGDYDVAQVAYAVGYEYPANFTAAFKRHFGELPRHWKRRQLAKGTPVR
ncbi:MAG TPA: AraC family transcriptional regulator [Steroidobacteraceae bacterium]|nr:AraC family transcriptional regulator [Steroidobacteraceae bacterium]